MVALPLPKRHRLRLADFDYVGLGACFVTICVQNRRWLFGRVEATDVHLNESGRMVAAEWIALPSQFVGLTVDEYIVMPDHLHGILMLSDSRAPRSLSEIIGAFKSTTTRKHALGVREDGWPKFDRHLWQRSYYDHIIRNDASLREIREYIRTNPLRWSLRHGSSV